MADDKTAAEVVTICGSSKFRDEILSEVARLTRDGLLVISLGMFGHHDFPDLNWDTDATDLKRMLDALHRQKIDMADRVHVVTVGGYYGESTAREIEYARSLGKPVTFGDVPAVRRVAPDRAHLAERMRSQASMLQTPPVLWIEIQSARMLLNEGADALASGVLGVPADQRTADRETIAQAIHDGPNAQAQYAKARIPTHSWESCLYQEQYRLDADAVLAVLVPADRPDPVVLVTTPASGGVTTDRIFDPQMAYERGRRDAEQYADQVRAETLEAFGTAPIPGFEHWTESKKDAAARIYDLIRARAAEYRKAAGA